MDTKGLKQKRFVEAIDSHKGIIYKVANIYCRNKTNLDDLVQEILIQVWLSFDSYKEEYKFSTWLYRVALNVAISFDRKEKRHETHKSAQLAIELQHEEQYNNDDDAAKRIKLLYQIIKEFKEIDRALLLLQLDGYTQQEISEIIGISASNVATKTLRLRGKLRKRFNEIYKEQ